jgi:acid stress-induced BolA-like protein IbaG/YrbA
MACRERDGNPAKIMTNNSKHDNNNSKHDNNNSKHDNIDVNKIRSTHFRIIIVSQIFYRMSYIDRLCLIYEELLKSDLLGAHVDHHHHHHHHHDVVSHNKQNNLNGNDQSSKSNSSSMVSSSSSSSSISLAKCAPLKLKLASTYGPHVCSLGQASSS